MRKILPLFLAFIMLMPVANAVAPVDLSANRAMTGGYMLEISNNSTVTTAGGLLTDAPSIAEVYTATWCVNCVDAEHAMMDAIGSDDVTILAYHRYIGESQDPFGTEEGDNRWIDLYGESSSTAAGTMRAAPTIIFNGTQLRVGSAAEGESLQADYEELLAESSPNFSEHGGTSSQFNWDGNNSSGAFTWSLDVNSNFNASHWKHRLMVVEHSAYFPDGSNGLEYYEDVVRAVITLEGELNSSGDMFGNTTTLDLPAAWDGDDLSLVLVHEVVFPEDMGRDSGESEEGDREETLIGIAIWVGVAIFFCFILPLAGVAFIVFFTRNEDKHVGNPYTDPVQ